MGPAVSQQSTVLKALVAFAAGALVVLLLAAAPLAARADGEATYTVSMRKSTNLASPSICDTLFTRNAAVELSADGSANVTLFVVDPVPNYASTGQSLKTVSVDYNGTTYPATLHTDQKTPKPFSDDAMFFPSAGTYPATPITFTLPQEALADSVSGKVTCRAFVNLLGVEQEFLMVLQPKPEGADDDPETPSSPTDPSSGSDPSSNSGSQSDTKPSTSGGSNGSGTSGTPNTSGTSNSSKKSTKKSSSKTTEYTYTYNASFRKATSFSTASICDPLFAAKADVVVSGSLAKITVYVVDPIPNYSPEGSPLSNVKFTYGGKTYAATYKSSSKVRKSFGTSSMFISKAGTYPATPITVTLPKGAVAASAKGGLMCQAFIKAVLGATQEFYVVLSGGKLVSTKTVSAPSLSKSSATSRSTSGGSSGSAKTTTSSSGYSGSSSGSGTSGSSSPSGSSDSNPNGSGPRADGTENGAAPENATSATTDDPQNNEPDANNGSNSGLSASNPQVITLSVETPPFLWALTALALAITVASGVYARRRNQL